MKLGPPNSGINSMRSRAAARDTTPERAGVSEVSGDAGHGARQILFLPTHRAQIGAPSGGGRASSGCSTLSVGELERGAVPE